MGFVNSKKNIEYHIHRHIAIFKKNYNKDKDFCPLHKPNKIKILLTSPDKLRLADFAVTVADGVHVVLVELTTACICEVARVVWRPALCHFASVVLSRCHIVEGVVGGLPVEDDHIAGATVNCLRVSWSAGDWWKETENQTLEHNNWGGNGVEFSEFCDAQHVLLQQTLSPLPFHFPY